MELYEKLSTKRRDFGGEIDDLKWYQEVTLKEHQAHYDMYEHFFKKVYIAKNKDEHLNKENGIISKRKKFQSSW